MLVLDVDGVMTDTRIWWDSQDGWKRFFSIRDGVGIKLLLNSGYQVAVITGSKSEDIRQRIQSLSIPFFFEGSIDKMPAFEQLQKQSKLTPEQMAYVGDDYFDLPILEKVKFSVSVPDAIESVKSKVHYITKNPGGHGAVREVCDLIHQYGAMA